MPHPPLVIIESPYSGDLERNVAYARAAVRDSLLRGEAPLAFHLLYTQPGILNDNLPEERELGILRSFWWQLKAYLLAVYTDHGISYGMQLGIESAKARGLPIEYRKILTDE